jgi:hypothetical protein
MNKAVKAVFECDEFITVISFGKKCRCRWSFLIGW